MSHYKTTMIAVIGLAFVGLAGCNGNINTDTALNDASPQETISGDTIENTNNANNNETIDDTQEVSSTNINGTLSYPAGSMPLMTVCALDTATNEETCVNTTEPNQMNYSIELDQGGNYLVYAQALDTELKAYYTYCDTLEDSFVPACNPNAGTGDANRNDANFICYEDETCKAAYTPLELSIETGETLELQQLMNGRYIPCSYPNEVCNDPAFDVWEDYLE